MKLQVKQADAEAVDLQSITERQAKLIAFVQSLDPEYRHSFTLVCRGKEPWKIEEAVEHRDIDLRR